MHKILKEGTHSGFKWLILQRPERSYRNGYCVVPPSHPWYKQEYSNIDADIEREITFSGELPGIDGWLVGFFTGNYNDLPDPNLEVDPNVGTLFKFLDEYFCLHIEGGKIPTEAYVQGLCEQLCEEAAKIIGENKCNG